MGKLQNRLSLLWSERDRVWRAYKHFHKYRKHYNSKELNKIFNTKHYSPLFRAIKYTEENPRVFDVSYFSDVEKWFKKKKKNK